MTSASRQRKHPSWIDEFVDATSYINSPKIYRKWAALYAVSSALQRKTHLIVQGRELFPNLFVVLVGPPGLGKSAVLEPIMKLLGALPNISLSPARLSPEKFIQLVSRCYKILPQPEDPYFGQSAYSVIISELSTFLRPQDDQIVTTLTDFYDCAKSWRYATLARDEDKIENLYLTLIGGTTPKTLAENFGAKAIGMGFTARVNFIYSEDYRPPDLFGVSNIPDLGSFGVDLLAIHKLHGRFTFSSSAARTLQSLVNTGIQPAPTDPKFAEYLPRRWLHLTKLAMIYSAAESSALRIEPHHLELAKQTLLEAEVSAPLAFDYITGNPLATATREIVAWVGADYKINGRPIPESALKKILLKDVQPQYVNSVLSELVQSGQLLVVTKGNARFYTPTEA